MAALQVMLNMMKNRSMRGLGPPAPEEAKWCVSPFPPEGTIASPLRRSALCCSCSCCSCCCLAPSLLCWWSSTKGGGGGDKIDLPPPSPTPTNTTIASPAAHAGMRLPSSTSFFHSCPCSLYSVARFIVVGAPAPRMSYPLAVGHAGASADQQAAAFVYLRWGCLGNVVLVVVPCR